VKFPTWNNKEKQEYRKFVIDTCGKFSGEYWTTAGSCLDANGKHIVCEYSQCLSNGISPRQFHAVDIDRDVININKSIHPETNWHHGDFYKVMRQHAVDSNFNPNVVVYDGVTTPKYGVEYLARILQLLDDYCPQQVLVFANFILQNWNYSFSIEPENVVDMLERYYRWPDHLKLSKDVRVSKISSSIIGSFVLIKEVHRFMRFTVNTKLTI